MEMLSSGIRCGSSKKVRISRVGMSWISFTRVSHSIDVTWTARSRFSANLLNPADTVLGTEWNFGISKNLVITPSYYYFTFRTASGALGHGQTPILGFTLQLSRGSLSVSNRNRFFGGFGHEVLFESLRVRPLHAQRIALSHHSKHQRIMCLPLVRIEQGGKRGKQSLSRSVVFRYHKPVADR